MKLYLVRHGQPNPEETDPEKGLSDVGKNEISKLAESIKHLNINSAEIWHSGKARAEQTAGILTTSVNSSQGLVEKTGLKPNDPVDSIAIEIVAVNSDLMLVGHLPFMSKLASLLLAGDKSRCSIDFNTGGFACFEYNKGRWSLNWLVHPGLVGQGRVGSFQSYH